MVEQFACNAQCLSFCHTRRPAGQTADWWARWSACWTNATYYIDPYEFKIINVQRKVCPKCIWIMSAKENRFENSWMIMLDSQGTNLELACWKGVLHHCVSFSSQNNKHCHYCYCCCYHYHYNFCAFFLSIDGFIYPLSPSPPLPHRCCCSGVCVCVCFSMFVCCCCWFLLFCFCFLLCFELILLFYSFYLFFLFILCECVCLCAVYPRARFSFFACVYINICI